VSLPSSANIGAPKPGTNVYTVMLILSFCALLTATMLLAMELSRFGSYPQWKATAGGS
jgi:hypothetical protein